MFLIWSLAVLICTSGAGVGYFVFKKLRKKRAASQAGNRNLPEADVRTKVPVKSNAVYLFADFMVRDRNNKDITYMFSAKLKQVFCLILQYSEEEEGITSQRLSEILWPDRPAGKVKNSRGVTMNHLRKALAELDGIELVYSDVAILL